MVLVLHRLLSNFLFLLQDLKLYLFFSTETCFYYLYTCWLFIRNILLYFNLFY